MHEAKIALIIFTILVIYIVWCIAALCWGLKHKVGHRTGWDRFIDTIIIVPALPMFAVAGWTFEFLRRRRKKSQARTS